MSPLTHAMAGAWLGYLSWKTVPGFEHSCSWEFAVGIGAMIGNIPDIDAILLVPTVPQSIRSRCPMLEHRGLTHSLWLLPVWGLLTSLMFYLVGCSMFGLAAFAMGVGCAASHLLLDMLDGSIGVLLLPGLSSKYFRFSVALVNDIDVLQVGKHRVRPATYTNLAQRIYEESVFAVLPINVAFLAVLRYF